MASYDAGDFARRVLARLGAPASANNLAFLAGWFKREGTKAAYNPLATTLDYGQNTKFNSVGVRNYADLNTGVEATARTISSHYYPGILADLKAGRGDLAAQEHTELKTWSGGGYDQIAIGNANFAQLPTGTMSGTIGGGPLDAIGNALSDANPLNVAGNAANAVASGFGDALKAVVRQLYRLSAFGVLLAGGAALVIVGGYRLVAPDVKNALDAAGDVAAVAAVA